MKRWTIEDLEKTTDLKFAACILNERRESLNPYTPLSQKLDKAKNLILRMDGYAEGWGSGTEASTEDILKTLYRDGYHAAARRIENMLVDLKDRERERQLLDGLLRLSRRGPAEVKPSPGSPQGDRPYGAGNREIPDGMAAGGERRWGSESLGQEAKSFPWTKSPARSTSFSTTRFTIEGGSSHGSLGAWPHTFSKGCFDMRSERRSSMKRADAVKIIHEIFETDTYGFRDSMTDEQIEAIQMALTLWSSRSA